MTRNALAIIFYGIFETMTLSGQTISVPQSVTPEIKRIFSPINVRPVPDDIRDLYLKAGSGIYSLAVDMFHHRPELPVNIYLVEGPPITLLDNWQQPTAVRDRN